LTNSAAAAVRYIGSTHSVIFPGFPRVHRGRVDVAGTIAVLSRWNGLLIAEV
jgi:hypothetical protein